MPVSSLKLAYWPSVDWDNDRVFERDGYEDLVSRTLIDPAPETDVGRDQATGIAQPLAGKCSFTVYNDDGVFDPDNAGSPLYGKIHTNRHAQFTAGIGDRIPYRSHLLYRSPLTPYRGQEQIPLFQGRVESFDYQDSDGLKTVKINCLGNLGYYSDKKIIVPISSSVTTGDAVNAILNSVNIAVGDRVVSTGFTTILKYWVDDATLITALKQVLNTEGPGAAFYEDAAGLLHFEDRHYRDTEPRCLTPQHAYDTETNIVKIEINPRREAIINRATAMANRRGTVALGVVWTFGQTLTFTSSQSRRLVIRPQSPVDSAVTPVSGTDFTVSSGSIASVTLSGAGGGALYLTMVAGVGGATVTGLQLRAVSYPLLDSTDVESEPPNPESTDDFGDQVQALGNWPEVDPNVLKDLCDEMVLRYQFERPIFKITVIPNDLDDLRTMLKHQISDRIEIRDARSHTTVHAFIDRIQHHPSRSVHMMTLYCEYAWSGSIGDVSRWGTDTWGSARWSS